MRCDFETRAKVDLRKRGSAVYFECPYFRTLGLSYRIDNGELKDWEWGQPCPDDIRKHIETNGNCRAFNATFERGCFNWLADNCGWPRFAIDRYHCTAAEASALGLPRSLEGVGTVLRLKTQKDKEGAALIKLFCMPRKPKPGEDPTGTYFNEPEDFPADYARFVSYRRDDVLTEEAAAERLIPLSAYEHNVYVMDQKINDRGIRVDRRSIVSAVRLAEKTKLKLDLHMKKLTGGQVGKCSEVGKLLAWIKSRGVEIDALAKADILDVLDAKDIPPDVREALGLRQQAAKASVSKLTAMLLRACRDGRVKHSFIYHRASTGRWQNVGVNFANLPRPRKVYEEAGLDPAQLFEAFRLEDPDLLEAMYGPELGRPLDLISDAIRGFLIAAPGHEIIQADYSSIEGCVIAWLAGEEWKVQAMHELFADPSLPDLYRRTAAQIMNMTTDVITKKHPLRQSVGKVSELACLGPDTQVLTDHGVKVITDISISDKLWDGVEWVKHQGVIGKGVKPVVSVDGIAVTANHMFLTPSGWLEAKQLVSDVSILSQALVIGSESLSSLALNTARPEVCAPSPLSVLAAQNRTESEYRICDKVDRPVAITALNKSVGSLEKVISAMTISFPMKAIVAGYSTASQRVSIAARTLKTKAIRITEAAASLCSGDRIAAPIWNTSSPSQAGTILRSNLIGSKSMVTTLREIFASSRINSIKGTNVNPEKCKTRSAPCAENSTNCVPVFDIVNAGPRNRFTILSNSGAFIVHNCGYQGSVSAFYSMSRLYGVELDQLYPNVWQTASDEMREKAQQRYANAYKRGASRAREMSREAWMACWLIVQGWRKTNAAIAKLWTDQEKAARAAVESPGSVIDAGMLRYIVEHGYLFCQLPSKRCLAYASPKLSDQVWAKVLCDDGTWSAPEVMLREQAEMLTAKGKARIEGDTSPSVTVLGVDKSGRKMRRDQLYGGLLAQNATQAIARDILVNGMLKAEEAGYPIIGHVYDEMFAEVPSGTGDVKAFEKLICEAPEWAAGLPLQADGWQAKRYRK